MDELVAAVSTLAHGGQSSRGGADETATALAGFLSRCACPRLAARVVALAASLAAAPNADRASAFTRAVCRAGGVEVCLALTRAAALNEPALNEPGRGSVIGDGRGEEGGTERIRDPSPSGGAGLVAACVRLLGRLVAREAEVAGATSALVERAVGHCLRRAPAALLRRTLRRRDASRADFFGAKAARRRQLCDASSIGADAFAREISLSTSPVRVRRGRAVFWARRWPRSTSLPSRLGGGAFAITLSWRAHRGNRSMLTAGVAALAVEVLAASANDDVVRAGNDLLDVQARHALKLREGWRTIESVAASLCRRRSSCHRMNF